MAIDWNWFFSSFSQSAAALLAIIAAFVISRLLGLSEKISTSISQFDDLVIEFDRIRAKISIRNFRWYTKMITEYGGNLKEDIRKGEFENLNRDEILAKIYKSDNRLYKIDDAVLEVFDELYESRRPKRQKSSNVGELIITNSGSYNLDSIEPAGLWESVNLEKEAINQVEIEAKSLIQHFQKNLHELNSFRDSIRPLKIIIMILLISFPLTVIYPLHFMPVETNQELTITFNLINIIQSMITFKFLLLSIFFISIEGILVYFLILTGQINNRLNSAVQGNSGDFRSIKNYSEYFEEN
jgi:hypothetical protein